MGAQATSTVPTWTLAIPIVAAFIAFTGVALTLVLSWRNANRQLRSAHTLKIAEMRQEWINSLRDSMSKFQSYGVTPGLSHTSEREFYECGTRIELLMNPKDPDYEELQNCLYDFLSADELVDKYGANPRFVAICQRILKREWDTLKREIASAG
ncbi:hypothetical protein [Acidocella sp.]|uniref:hypothetical protein n=1 Tax=Acidocella sp. TaxID=50710 RepID=UPI002638E1FA|nr:hypothetical protein [Acidocella sp.]